MCSRLLLCFGYCDLFVLIVMLLSMSGQCGQADGYGHDDE